MKTKRKFMSLGLGIIAGALMVAVNPNVGKREVVSKVVEAVVDSEVPKVI